MAARFSIEAAFTVIDRAIKPVSKIQKRIKRFASLSVRSVSRLGKAFAKVGAVMGKSLLAGAALAGAAATAAIFKTAALGDEAAKTARRLGVTAESLQELRFAADRQGVAAGVLDSSFMALQKRVGELKSGTGSLYGFLKKTGDKAFIRQIVLAKNTEEAFELVTKKVATIEDPMKKAAFAAAAFSRSGIKMLSFMEAGQEGIRQLRFEARKYGAVISNEAAAQSEIFVDSLTNLKSALAGIGKTFASKVNPFLSVAMQNFADFWALNKNIISAGMDRFLKFLAVTFQAIKPSVTALLSSLRELFSSFWVAVTSLLPEFKTETDTLSKSIIALSEFLKEVAKAGITAFRFITEISPFIKPLITMFLIYKGIMIAIALATKGWAIAQGILNAILNVNPITLIIVAVAALTTGIIYLVQNWGAVVSAFKSGARAIWDFLSELLDNPFISLAGMVFAPFITLPALIVKHWEPLLVFFSNLWTSISELFSAGMDFVLEIVKPFEGMLSRIGGLFGGGGAPFAGAAGDRAAGVVSPAAAAVVAGGGGRSFSPQVITRSSQMRSVIKESLEQRSTASLLIRDETGRAQLTRQGKSSGVEIKMINSGDG